MINNILFVGLGAVGTTVASQFMDAGYEVDALCSQDRIDRYNKKPFIINNKEYRFNYYTNSTYNKKCDLVIIATKYYSLIEAIDQLKGLLADDCVILSLLNGIDSEDIIGSMYGMDRMLYGFISHMDSTKVDNICNFTASGAITLGEKDGSVSSRLLSVVSEFDRAGVKYNISKDILKQQWWKYMANIGMNQVSAVIDASYGVFKSCEDIRELLMLAMNEVILIAGRKGIEFTTDDTDRVFGMFENLDPEGMTSMHQDVKAKRRTEVDMLAKQLIAMGEELGIDTPVNKVLYHQLKTIEFMY